MRRPTILSLIVVGTALALILIQPSSTLSSIQTSTSTPTIEPVPQFYRLIDIVKVRVVSSVRIRTEPSSAQQNATVIRLAQIGEEFFVRQDEETVEAEGYSWIPVIVDNQEAWIAQQGFLQAVVAQQQVPVEQAEVEMVYASDLPIGATQVIVKDSQLYAVNQEGGLIAVWDWGNKVGQGQWATILNHQLNSQEVTGVEGLVWSDSYGGYTRRNSAGQTLVIRAVLQGELDQFPGTARVYSEVTTANFGTITLEMPTEDTWRHTNGSFVPGNEPMWANPEEMHAKNPDYYELRDWGDYPLIATPENFNNGLTYVFTQMLLHQNNPDTGVRFTEAEANAWLNSGQPIPVSVVKDWRHISSGMFAVNDDSDPRRDKIDVRLVDPQAGVSFVVLPQYDAFLNSVHSQNYPQIITPHSSMEGTEEAVRTLGFEVNEVGRLIIYIYDYYAIALSTGEMRSMVIYGLYQISTNHSGARSIISEYLDGLIFFLQNPDKFRGYLEAFGFFSFEEGVWPSGIFITYPGYLH